MRETASLLLAAEKCVMRNNYIKANFNCKQDHCKSRFYGNRYKTVDHVESEYSYL